jgi:hypothetical protein
LALTVATVETAIETVLTSGQSVTIDGITYTRASLGQLYQLRDSLKDEEGVASTRPTFRAFNIGGMGY